MRATERFFKSVVEGLGVEPSVPDYTTMCRRHQRLEVSLPRVPRGEPLHVVWIPWGLRCLARENGRCGNMGGQSDGLGASSILGWMSGQRRPGCWAKTACHIQNSLAGSQPSSPALPAAAKLADIE
jgi:hypothetical protein